MGDWQDITTAPRDATVLVVTVPSPDNHTFAAWPPTVHAAYIDDDGNVCNYETLTPDPGLFGQFWRSTHWMPFPPAPQVPA